MNETRQEVQEASPRLHDPLVSIIIPIYNERELIREVLRRVRAKCAAQGVVIATAQRAVQLFEKGAGPLTRT